ncbi:MAG: hypothetical protein LUF90_04685 [Rikenellaceae bacterium]|nr:hypothetical protein [Rikenellaceae bacterium]
MNLDDNFYNGEVSGSFLKNIHESPKWKPAIHNGEIISSKYLITITWGHFRTYTSPNLSPKEKNYYDKDISLGTNEIHQ